MLVIGTKSLQVQETSFLIPTVRGTRFPFSSMLLVLLLVWLIVTIQRALQKYWAQNQDPTSG